MPGNENGATTAICGFNADEITIRGKNLVTDFMGNMDFVTAFLHQSLGHQPTPIQTNLINTVMVTIMEHGLVPSAVVARLTHYGAPENYQGAIAAGLLGVGDRYAGTSSSCGALLERMQCAEDARAEAVAIIAEHQNLKIPVPGFGHPIHKDTDPRVDRLLELARNSGTDGQYLNLMTLLESTLCEVTGKTLVTNISARHWGSIGGSRHSITDDARHCTNCPLCRAGGTYSGRNEQPCGASHVAGGSGRRGI